MSEDEVLHWVEEHVSEIRMLVVGPHETNRFSVCWIDCEGSHIENERCNSLRELAERHLDK